MVIFHVPFVCAPSWCRDRDTQLALFGASRCASRQMWTIPNPNRMGHTKPTKLKRRTHTYTRRRWCKMKPNVIRRLPESTANARDSGANQIILNCKLQRNEFSPLVVDDGHFRCRRFSADSCETHFLVATATVWQCLHRNIYVLQRHRSFVFCRCESCDCRRRYRISLFRVKFNLIFSP